MRQLHRLDERVGANLKNTLSTVTIAGLLGVTAASISRWVDAGRLKAGRTPGGHRRVTREELIAFLQRQKLPIPPELKPSPPRVLVVDEKAAVTKWITAELRARHPDFEVLEAHDGFLAGEILASSRPDVVVLDLLMPGVDSLKVCRRIKARAETKQTAVIAMTAYPSEQAERGILESGARACLSKPFEIGVLIAEVRSAMSEQNLLTEPKIGFTAGLAVA